MRGVHAHRGARRVARARGNSHSPFPSIPVVQEREGVGGGDWGPWELGHPKVRLKLSPSPVQELVREMVDADVELMRNNPNA